ncbi:MAG: transcription termination factor NusA [Lachnospiraceae bacterium]
MNKELSDALDNLAKEKNISKRVLLEAIENSLIQACKNHFGKTDNIHVSMNYDTCEYELYAEKVVSEEVTDPLEQIALVNAQKFDRKASIGDTVKVPIQSKEFGRIATTNGINVIRQKIREETRRADTEYYKGLEREVITGIVQRYVGNNVSVNLGRADALLMESEQVKGERFQPTEHIKLYILKVEETSKGPKISISRTHPEMVKRLFENEVAELQSGVVEIMAISREAGSRTKMAVRSHDPNVDAVGACVGINGARVNAVVQELRGEKIDIMNWDEDPALLIENALSPAKVICVAADEEEKTAVVIVPDYQLSLAIGKEGQNARLAAKLTGYKIDIKSETQAKEQGLWEEFGLDDRLQEGEYDFESQESESKTESEMKENANAVLAEDETAKTENSEE